MLYTFSKANYDQAWLIQTLAQFDENDIALLWQDGVLQAVKNAECFANVNTYVLSADLRARGLTDMNKFPEVELNEVVTLTEYYFPQIAF